MLFGARISRSSWEIREGEPLNTLFLLWASSVGENSLHDSSFEPSIEYGAQMERGDLEFFSKHEREIENKGLSQHFKAAVAISRAWSWAI